MRKKLPTNFTGVELVVQEAIWSGSGVRHLAARVCAAEVEELSEE